MNLHKRAIVLGATGLIGSQLLQLLLEAQEYERVIAITRKPLADHEKLQQVIVPDFSRLAAHANVFAGVQDVFCCLGTTMKQAGSQQRFRQVDYDYPLTAANIAQTAGVQRFLLVSAMGANPKSRIFYSRVKGETERDIRLLRLPSLSIFRPSLLLGDRKQFRFGESMASWLLAPLSPLFRGSLLKIRPIQARAVACVMYRVAQMFTPGVHIYENDQMHKMTIKD